MSETNKYSSNVIDFTYIPKKGCKHFKQAKMTIDGYPGHDSRLYTRCIACGTILRTHVDNIKTVYY